MDRVSRYVAYRWLGRCRVSGVNVWGGCCVLWDAWQSKCGEEMLFACIEISAIEFDQVEELQCVKYVQGNDDFPMIGASWDPIMEGNFDGVGSR